MFKGKKTYLVVAGTLLGYWGSFLTGEVELSSAMQMTVQALLAAAIRNGIG